MVSHDRSDDVMPDDVIVAKDGYQLRLVWAGGDDLALRAGTLRAACRCAWCTRDRVLACFAEPPDTLSLAGVDALGTHGLHLKFSDGHAHGIFPWAYLRQLADDALVSTSLPNPLIDADGVRTGLTP